MNFDAQRLSALRAAVDTGTFEKAAQLLRVTPSAVSQRIKSLESEVGRVLLQRSKPVRPTESGEVLLRLARQIDALTDDVAVTLGGSAGAAPDGDPAGRAGVKRVRVRVPLAVNADSLATWLLPALAPLADDLDFDFHREDESLTTELLRQGTVMAAVTAVPDAVQGCSSTLLGAMRYRPMATREFAEQWFPNGVTAAALARAPMVVFDRSDTLQHGYLTTVAERERLSATATASPSPSSSPALPDPPCQYVPASADFVRAIQLGFGWGMIPELQSSPQNSLDPLVLLDPLGVTDVPLYWQQWQLHTAALERVAAAVGKAAEGALLQR